MRICATLLGLVLVGLVAFASPASGHAGVGGGCNGTAGSEVHRAGLVVTFGGEQATQLFCVEFTEDSISGIELLRRSGLSIVTYGEGGLGSGVCAIDGIGSLDPTNCFKYSIVPPYRSWVYFRWTGSGWQFSSVGASTRQIHDGDIDGWSWGSGAGAVPEAPGGMLDPPTPTATPPTFTPTPVPATNTPRPVVTPDPTSTGVPADTPEPVITIVPTIAPAGAAAEPSAVAGGGAPPASAPSGADVAGVQAAPRDEATAAASGTPATATRTPGASPTARVGVIVVDPTQARGNAATAERGEGGDGGGGTNALAGFAVVAVALVGGVGVMLYRRRAQHA